MQNDIINLLDEQMSDSDKSFYVALGKQVAELRKAQQMTQVQLAEQLGISQQLVASYEAGRRKIPASVLPTLSHTLVVPLEDLLGVEKKSARRGPAPKLQQQLELISRLPRSKQKFVIEMLDTIIQQQKMTA